MKNGGTKTRLQTVAIPSENAEKELSVTIEQTSHARTAKVDVRLTVSDPTPKAQASSLTPTGTPDPPATHQSSKGAAAEVVNKLAAEDFEGVRASFNEQIGQGLSAEQLRYVWRAAIQYHGNLQS